jgi:hypothetical protein
MNTTTALQELRAFAQALEPICKRNSLKFACLQSELDLEPAPRWTLAPCLYLTAVAEELTCGHIVPTAEGVNLFIRVRTPFAASSTLKFVTLRTYALILVSQRGMKLTRFERDLGPAAAQADAQQILAQATEAATQTQTAEQAFIQPEQAAPFPTKDPELLAYRATFCSGTVIGTVLPSSSSTQQTAALALTPNPAQIYLL